MARKQSDDLLRDIGNNTFRTVELLQDIKGFLKDGLSGTSSRLASNDLGNLPDLDVGLSKGKGKNKKGRSRAGKAIDKLSKTKLGKPLVSGASMVARGLSAAAVPLSVGVAGAMAARETADMFSSSFGGAEEDKDAGFKLIHKLHKSGVIDYNFGPSDILNWKAIEILPEKELKLLIGTDEFIPTDVAKIQQIIEDKKSGNLKPDNRTEKGIERKKETQDHKKNYKIKPFPKAKTSTSDNNKLIEKDGNSITVSEYKKDGDFLVQVKGKTKSEKEKEDAIKNVSKEFEKEYKDFRTKDDPTSGDTKLIEIKEDFAERELAKNGLSFTEARNKIAEIKQKYKNILKLDQIYKKDGTLNYDNLSDAPAYQLKDLMDSGNLNESDKKIVQKIHEGAVKAETKSSVTDKPNQIEVSKKQELYNKDGTLNYDNIENAKPEQIKGLLESGHLNETDQKKVQEIYDELYGFYEHPYTLESPDTPEMTPMRVNPKKVLNLGDVKKMTDIEQLKEAYKKNNFKNDRVRQSIERKIEESLGKEEFSNFKKEVRDNKIVEREILAEKADKLTNADGSLNYDNLSNAKASNLKGLLESGHLNESDQKIVQKMYEGATEYEKEYNKRYISGAESDDSFMDNVESVSDKPTADRITPIETTNNILSNNSTSQVIRDNKPLSPLSVSNMTNITEMKRAYIEDNFQKGRGGNIARSDLRMKLYKEMGKDEFRKFDKGVKSGEITVNNIEQQEQITSDYQEDKVYETPIQQPTKAKEVTKSRDDIFKGIGDSQKVKKVAGIVVERDGEPITKFTKEELDKINFIRETAIGMGNADPVPWVDKLESDKTSNIIPEPVKTTPEQIEHRYGDVNYNRGIELGLTPEEAEFFNPRVKGNPRFERTAIDKAKLDVKAKGLEPGESRTFIKGEPVNMASYEKSSPITGEMIYNKSGEIEQKKNVEPNIIVNAPQTSNVNQTSQYNSKQSPRNVESSQQYYNMKKYNPNW